MIQPSITDNQDTIVDGQGSRANTQGKPSASCPRPRVAAYVRRGRQTHQPQPMQGAANHFQQRIAQGALLLPIHWVRPRQKGVAVQQPPLAQEQIAVDRLRLRQVDQLLQEKSPRLQRKRFPRKTEGLGQSKRRPPPRVAKVRVARPRNRCYYSIG